ncbi:unnamed protein product [Rodentolepis nana]|uniref:IgGFc_binding domain-containing protein n=1 Tax=Rodentolepis nana TaxID=102285 RepID=A0A0R3T1I2_RODNA|nr:unnamed protein product [Rodentolepis nana]
MILHTLVLADDEENQLEMLPKDGRVVFAPLYSKVEYETLLPGNYKYIYVGMHKKEIVDGDCSTPLFDCQITKRKDRVHHLKLSATMNYGLTRVTLTNTTAIPIVILFYADHFWPEINSYTFQYIYKLPLVTNAKKGDLVTLNFYILHMSITGYAEFDVLATSRGETIYNSKQGEILDGYPHILNIQTQHFLFHSIISMTVEQNYSIDYYSVKYNDEYNTHVIVWGKDTDLPTFNVMENLVSLLPLSDIIGQFLGSAGYNNLYGSITIISK